MSVNARISERNSTSSSNFANIRRAELVAAKPAIPAIAKTTKTDDVKIATPSIYLSNDVVPTVDEITRILFDKISAKDIASLAKTNDVSINFQVKGLTNNISNIVEIANSLSSPNIIPIKTAASVFQENVKNYNSTTSNSGVISINIPSENVIPNTKIVLQIAVPSSIITLTSWGTLLP